MADDGLLDALRVPFPVAEVKKNEKGLDYVSIDGYIRRMLETAGLLYDFKITESSVTPLPPDPKFLTSTGKPQYLAQVRGDLCVWDGNSSEPTQRSGVGADVSFDADKALKTAQAEAFKKACHHYGIALELWDEGHREALADERRQADALPGLKYQVYELAQAKLENDKPTQAQLAKHFGVKVADLQDVAVLRKIVAEHG